jgi:flagellar biosynthesis GTPase FlhF
VARKVPLPFSSLTTGQDVPDDIESANPTRIARLILGREKLQS